MKKSNEHLRVNFGSDPFVFDIDSMVEVSTRTPHCRIHTDQTQRQRNKVKEDINKTSADVLDTMLDGTTFDETTLVQQLVAQYLAHDGYVETARAFNREVRNQRQPLNINDDALALYDPSQDIHALNRQSTCYR